MSVAGGAVAAPASAVHETHTPLERHAAMRLRVSWLLVFAVVAALIVAQEFVHPLAWRVPTLRATLETCMTLFGLGSAFLLREDFLRSRRLEKLLLLSAVLILTATEFLSSALPAALHARLGSGFTDALPLGQAVAAGMLVLAALTPSDRLIRSQNPLIRGKNRPIAAVALLSLVVVGLAELSGLLLHSYLLGGTTRSGLSFARPLDHPLGLVVLLGSVVLFAFAAVAFDRRARLEKSDFLTLLAGAVLLLAGACLYRLAVPTVSPELVTLREAMRLIAYGLIFIAVLRLDLQLRSSMASAATIAERRRVAQDLHDGLAQDLALIAAHGERMSEELGAEHPVVVAARHALDVSRGTIRDLSEATARTVYEALDVVARELGSRFAIQITVDVQLDGELPTETRKQIARIVREAIANAARHGGATHVVVTLKRSRGGVSLRVCDDGCGIYDGSGRTRPEGFGLHSMRERATALSGSLAARSGKDGGTELEVVFP